MSPTDAENYEVVIIGAGINGAGLFRDLCLQGVKCLIVDKTDFGSGTSAAPSRLIHGGLKYLETGEFGLVAQSTLERNLLLKNAPHAVTPLPTMIPVFSWTSGIGAAIRTLFGSTSAPRNRGALLVKIGLAIYDFYGSRDRVMPRHRLTGKKMALASLPELTPEIVAAGTYYDAKVTAPERLVYELVADGLKANPQSVAMNHTRLVSARDGVLTFERSDGSAVVARPAIVVNAAGPWIDEVNAALGSPTKLIGGTKGSHMLLDHDPLLERLDGRMIYFEADDGRICLVYGYLGRVLVGSTDIPADDPDDVRCTDEEIDYFLESLRRLLPGLAFSRDQIVYAYSGIRPLPASDATMPGLISRDHSAPVIEQVEDRPFSIVSLVGGKWTTFRGFAEEVADDLLVRLKRQRTRSTRHEPIGGGHGFPAGDEARRKWCREQAAETGLREDRLDVLLARYGTLALKIAMHEAAGDGERLPDAHHTSFAEIDWIVRNEMVVTLSDIIMRRTTLAVTGTVTRRDIEAIADVAASALNWDEAHRNREIETLVRHLVSAHGMKI